ncbi:MAG TPA: hypothetical protein VHH15_02435 [Actinophytocola sp.]|nr:hypothetical protein [Actinophytocola sp.]
MAHDNVMSTPIFDELLREMAQRAEPRTPPSAPEPPATPTPAAPPTRNRHRAD